MQVPIGSDRKSIFHGVIIHELVLEVKPMICSFLKRIVSVREMAHADKGLLKYYRIAREVIGLLILGYQLRNIILNVLPMPTKETAIRPSTRALLDMRDDFFANELSTNRLKEWEAMWKVAILMNDGDMYYYERIDHEVNLLYEKIKAGEWPLPEELPRAKWWGHDPVCPVCCQRKGRNKQVFADCPAEMHL